MTIPVLQSFEKDLTKIVFTINQLAVNANAAVGVSSVADGGTGVSTLAAHGVLIGNGTSAVNVTTPGTATQVLTSNGPSADPTFQTVAAPPTPPPSAAQGRLTLTTATPVLTATVSGATTIYYTPYVGQFVPLYNGSIIAMSDIGGELSQTTTDTTKSPAAVAASKNYDLFVWTDSGTFRCTRGPTWSTDTARGTGAGTTELIRVKGILLNANSITNGPAAQRGTYVGSVRSNGSSQIDFILSTTPTAGGTAGSVGVWNTFNRIGWVSLSMDSTDTWTYTTTAWRQSDNSAGMQSSFITGLGEDVYDACYQAITFGTGLGRTGIGLDSTTAIVGVANTTSGVATTIGSSAVYSATVGLGWHKLTALEFGATSLTFTGDQGLPTNLQSGLIVKGLF